MKSEKTSPLFEVVVGTYEEYILGYRLINKSETEDDKYVNIIQTFAEKSHIGSIRCMASHCNLVASGGTDDRIFIYDLLIRKEIQILLHHISTVNTIKFTPDGMFLLTGSDDGTIAVVNSTTWNVEVSFLKAHKGKPVTKISCHSSGKVAISLGNDHYLRMWDLVKGCFLKAINLNITPVEKNYPDCLSWSPESNYFAISGLRKIIIWYLETDLKTINHSLESKPTCICWLEKNDLLVGLDNGKIIQLCITEIINEINLFQAHDKRVKDMSYQNGMLSTCSSSGEITLWNVDVNDKFRIKKYHSINIGCRPTCISLISTNEMKTNCEIGSKRKEENVDQEIINLNEDSVKFAKKTNVVIEYDNEHDTEIENIIEMSRKKRRKVEIESPIHENVRGASALNYGKSKIKIQEDRDYEHDSQIDNNGDDDKKRKTSQQKWQKDEDNYGTKIKKKSGLQDWKITDCC